jgi:hypothetical protein
MSANIRYFLVGVVVVLGSVMAVRSLSASPEAELDDPPVAARGAEHVEIADAALAAEIHRFAAVARQRHELAQSP